MKDSSPEAAPASFGQRLRQLRVAARLTQEELAQAATLSTRSVSDLERGINLTARNETARLLADALKLTGKERESFLDAARGRATVAIASRTLPRDIPSFTGRAGELADLVAAVTTAGAGVIAIGGMAGVGKTSFAVHAAYALASRYPGGQIYLPLHAHTPGQQPAEPADALASLLQATGASAQQIPAGLEERAGMWRDHVAGRRILLLLDDALDSHQVRPLLPAAAGCLTLVTSRRRLTSLDDDVAISLDALPPDMAMRLLLRLADRRDLQEGDPALAEIAAACGCLPLALGMLARRLHHHPAWTAQDLAADLREARERLGKLRTEQLSVSAMLDLSYADLTTDQQRMFRRLGLHPGADFDAYAAAALDDIGIEAAADVLEGLYDHYLVSESAKGRYRFHDLIREYAHAVAEADRPGERIAAADRVLDYYLHVARLADRRIGRAAPVVAVVPPRHMPPMDSNAQAIAWLEAEHVNLHATAQFAAGRDRPGHAAAIPAATHEFMRRQGHWREGLAMERLAVAAARHGDGQLAEARALADLADMQYLTDDLPGATGNLERALDLYISMGNRLGEANTLTQLGTVRFAAGDPLSASDRLAEALKIYQAIGNRLGEANALTELGAMQEASGDLGAAEGGVTRALDLYTELGQRLGQAAALIRLGSVQATAGRPAAAVTSVTTALGLYHDGGDRPGEARALNSLGELATGAGTLEQAGDYYQRALAIARSMAPREEARALEGLGRCRIGGSEPEQGNVLLRQALDIYQQIRPPQTERIERILNDLGSFPVTGALRPAHRAAGPA